VSYWLHAVGVVALHCVCRLWGICRTYFHSACISACFFSCLSACYSAGAATPCNCRNTYIRAATLQLPQHLCAPLHSNCRNTYMSRYTPTAATLMCAATHVCCGIVLRQLQLQAAATHGHTQLLACVLRLMQVLRQLVCCGSYKCPLCFYHLCLEWLAQRL